MYDIGFPEINVTVRSESDDGRAILYTAEAAHRPECCANPACRHKIKPHFHSSKTNLMHDIRSKLDATIYHILGPFCFFSPIGYKKSAFLAEYSSVNPLVI